MLRIKGIELIMEGIENLFDMKCGARYSNLAKICNHYLDDHLATFSDREDATLKFQGPSGATILQGAILIC